MTAGAPSRTAWFHCFAGTAGDMSMAALIDAGADPEVVAETVGRLAVDGYALSFEAVSRCGIAATQAHVVVYVDADHDHEHDHDHDHEHHGHDQQDHRDHHPQEPEAAAAIPHRPYRVIRDLIAAAGLPHRVEQRALRTFHVLATVEAAIHRTAVNDVELHEVGAIDAIVDIVGSCAALEALGIDRIVCSPITVGQGTINAAHGQLPNPAPAVLELLASRQAPSRGIADHRELATPTGVALMIALADGFGPMPAMTVDGVGYGAGSADIPGRPNVVQVVLGREPAADTPVPDPGQPVQLFETNVDDATGEVLAHTIAALLGAGAHDAWVTPIVMKKGRPAHTVHVLCETSRSSTVSKVLIAETGSLGLRGTIMHRWPQQREQATVVVDGCTIRVKLTAGRAKVEHDDAAAAAAVLGRPLRDVLHAAEQAVADGRMHR